jgi:hypothetical protein
MAMTMRTSEPEVRTRTAVGPVPSTRLFVCAECRHAQLFAVQPRALCTLAGAPLEGQVLFAGQPGCLHMAPRRGADVMLAWTSPGAKVTTSRFRRRVPGTI